jgi:TatD DNase family protein
VTRWVDTHGHLHLRARGEGRQGDGLHPLDEDEPAAVLRRAAAVGVEWMVNPGTDLASSQESFRLAAQFPGVVFPTAGLHPHDASHWPEQADAIAALAVDAVAIGECGLDFYRNLATPEAQVVALRDQLRLAERLNKPVVVHCRDAFAGVHQLVEATGSGPRTVLHCWTGGPRWTKRFIDLGVTFSFAGPIAFATGDTVRRGAAVAPPERTMVETDTPYLNPIDKGAPNEPANVVKVGEALAGVWGMPVEQVAALTTATALRVFRGG